MHQLVANYFRYNDLPLVPTPVTYAVWAGPEVPLRADRVTVLCSGGKDSVHLAVRLLETGCAPADCQLVYVTNVNRSEAHYERLAVQRVAKELGVAHVLVPVTNGIRLNRFRHNIGLREQLLLGCALPHVVAFGSGRVLFGSMGREWEEFHPELYASHESAQTLYAAFLAASGIPVQIGPHLDYPDHDERWMLEDFIRRHRALLTLTASCYTQANFRERHHALLAAKVSRLPIYQGCGICLKCLRINAGLLLYDLEMATAPRAQWDRLRQHVLTAQGARFPNDARLGELAATLQAIP